MPAHDCIYIIVSVSATRFDSGNSGAAPVTRTAHILCALGPAAQWHNKDFQHHHHRALADPPTPQPPPATLSPTHPHPTCLLAPYLHRCSFSHHADRTQSTYKGTQSTYTHFKKSSLTRPSLNRLQPRSPRYIHARRATSHRACTGTLFLTKSTGPRAPTRGRRTRPSPRRPAPEMRHPVGRCTTWQGR